MSSAPQTASPSRHTVHLPAPTAWPIVLALGTTFLFAGIVMTWAVSLLGAILIVCAAVGWFHDVMPRERNEDVEVVTGIIEITSVSLLRTCTGRSFRSRDIRWAPDCGVESPVESR